METFNKHEFKFIYQCILFQLNNIAGRDDAETNMDAFNQFLPYYKKDIFGDFLNQYINDMLNKPIPYIYQYRPFAYNKFRALVIQWIFFYHVFSTSDLNTTITPPEKIPTSTDYTPITTPSGDVNKAHVYFEPLYFHQ